MNEQTYEISISRFVKSTQYQMKTLSECIARLKEFQRNEEWNNVKAAHNNCSQTIQRIKSEIKEMEKIRSQIVSQVETIPSGSIIAKIDEELKQLTRQLKKETDNIASLTPPYITFVPREDTSAFFEAQYTGPEMFQLHLTKNEHLAKDEELCSSFEKLQKDCEDLKFLMETFSNEIFKQKPTIDSIERNVNDTRGFIESGAANLKVALSYKTLSAATGGALLGTLVGGPIGMLAGAKIGAVIGLGSGLVGYFVGKYMQKPTE